MNLNKMSSIQNNIDSFVLIGLGNMGQKHLKHLLAEWPASKIYVYEARRSNSNVCSTMNVEFIQNFKELKQISENETNFIIASSTKTHLDYLNMRSLIL